MHFWQEVIATLYEYLPVCAKKYIEKYLTHLENSALQTPLDRCFRAININKESLPSKDGLMTFS